MKADAALTRLLRTIIQAAVVMAVMSALCRRRPDLFQEIWITSPSGATTVKMPLYRGLRIVRERKWKQAEVVPLAKLGRKDGLRLLIKGRLK